MGERILDWMEDTRMTQKVMVLLLFAGLTSIILYQFIVEPQRQRTQAFEQTLRSLDHQLATMMKEDRRSETLKEEIATLTSRTETRKRVLAVSMDHILAGILDKAQSVDVALTSWESEEPVPLPENGLASRHASAPRRGKVSCAGSLSRRASNASEQVDVEVAGLPRPGTA